MQLFLDTHVVIWLFAGLKQKFTPKISRILDQGELYVSPIVRLELAFLHEIKRINTSAEMILNALNQQIWLKEISDPIDAITHEAIKFDWTRDPFDRLLLGHAELRGYQFVTKDRVIRERFSRSLW